MKIPSKYLWNFFCHMMKTQKLRVFLYVCVILIFINGIASGADRDVIVGFKKPVGPSEQALIQNHGGVIKKSFHLIPAIASRLPENKIEVLKKDPGIAYIEDDTIFKASDEYTSSWGVSHIGSNTVHDSGFNGTGVKVAVLDTGINYSHEDLNYNYKGGYDFVFNDADPFDDSTFSHGTHVAGIIAAEKNGIGVVGVAPNAEIYAIKVLDGAGFGHASWIISGIQWAVDNDMKIISMSLEGPYDESLRIASDNAYNSGLLLVAAGGNTNGGGVTYPAAYDSVIAVTATDNADKTASFSSTGHEIELAAPGVNIYSTVSGGYNFMNGTSMAAPHVAGVAALVFSSDFKDINGDGIKDNKDVRELLHYAKDLGDQGRDIIYGYGLVNARMAVLGVPGIADIELILIRTNGPADKDTQKVTLSQGDYSITIHNNNLSKIEMEVYVNGVIQKDISSRFKFNRSDDIYLDMNVGSSVFDIVFKPYGGQGSTGYVTIRGMP